MSTSDLSIIWLSTLVGLAFIGAACVVYRIEGRTASPPTSPRRGQLDSPAPPVWLVVKSRDLRAVQSAFGMQNPRPCSWQQGLAGQHWLFVSDSLRGWILVAGHALPEPSEDVDECYRLVQSLSRKLGQVQLFHANVSLGHHGWVKAQRGRIVRAYVWAGNTVWNQGAMTPEEKALGLQCPDYAAELSLAPRDRTAPMQPNCEKVPQLAARWSVAWSDLNQFISQARCGITGDPPGPI